MNEFLKDTVMRARKTYYFIPIVCLISALFALTKEDVDDLVELKSRVQLLNGLNIMDYQLYIDSIYNQKLLIDTSRFDDYFYDIITDFDNVQQISDFEDDHAIFYEPLVFPKSWYNDDYFNDYKLVSYSPHDYVDFDSIYKDFGDIDIDSLKFINKLSPKDDISGFYLDSTSFYNIFKSDFLDLLPSSEIITVVDISNIKYSNQNTFTSSLSVTIEYSLNDPFNKFHSTFLIEGDFDTFDNSSFYSWLISQGITKDIVDTIDGDIYWLPNIDLDKVEINSMREYESYLTEEINKASLKDQSISIFSINIPGQYFYFASSLIILALLYNLYNSLYHLKNFKVGDLRQLKEFSWCVFKNSIFNQIEFYLVTFMAPFGLYLIFLDTTPIGTYDAQFAYPLVLISTIIIIFLSIIGYLYLRDLRLKIHSEKSIRRVKNRNRKYFKAK